MASYIVVANADMKSVTVYDARGFQQGKIYLTNGTICGTPTVSGDRVSIPFADGSYRYMVQYSLPQLTYITQIPLS